VTVIFLNNQPTTHHNLNKGLNEGLKTLLNAIKEHPGINAKTLSAQLDNRPIKTIERQLKALTEQGLVKREGSRKTGGYVTA
jgi:ATP-dependent DNA helicase RecG